MDTEINTRKGQYLSLSDLLSTTGHIISPSYPWIQPDNSLNWGVSLRWSHQDTELPLPIRIQLCLEQEILLADPVEADCPMRLTSYCFCHSVVHLLWFYYYLLSHSRWKCWIELDLKLNPLVTHLETFSFIDVSLLTESI